MKTIYVSPHEINLFSVGGHRAKVRPTVVCEAGGVVFTQDWRPPSDLEDVEFVLAKRFFHRKFQLPGDLKKAILFFLKHYHAKQDMEYDCYAFANTVSRVEVHKVTHMLRHWDTEPLPKRVRIGSVVFFLSHPDHFHHAAIYIGFGLYISVWGAGGDLEITTLEAMSKAFDSEIAMLAKPKPPTQ